VAAAGGALALAAGFVEKYSLIIAAEEARLKSEALFGGNINPYSLLYSSLHVHVEASEALAVAGAAALGFLVFLLAELLLALGAGEKPRLLVFRG